MTIDPRLRAVAAVAVDAKLGDPMEQRTWPSAEGLHHHGRAQVTALAERLDMDAGELVEFARYAVDEAIRVNVDQRRLGLDEPTIQLVVELATGQFLLGLQIGERLR